MSDKFRAAAIIKQHDIAPHGYFDEHDTGFRAGVRAALADDDRLREKAGKMLAAFDLNGDKLWLNCWALRPAYDGLKDALADSATDEVEQLHHVWQVAANLVRNLRELDEHEWEPDEVELRDLIETTAGFFPAVQPKGEG